MRPLSSVRFGVLGLVALWCARPVVAQACSIYTPPPAFALTPFPDDGATNVPTNTRIYFADDGTARELVVHASDEVVPTIQGILGGVRVVTPVVELAANTTFRIAGYDERSFTTGDGPFTGTQPPPRVTSQKGVDENDSPEFADQLNLCGPVPNQHVDFTLDMLGARHLLVDFDGASTLDAATMSGEISGSSKVSRYAVYAPGPQQVRFGSLDAAGNFSGWSAFVNVNMPEDRPGPCACVRSHHTAWPPVMGALLLLLGAVFRGPLSRARLRPHTP